MVLMTETNVVADSASLQKWSTGMFALGSAMSIMQAMNQHKQGKQKAENIGYELQESYLVDQQKLNINEIRTRSSIEDIQRTALKNSSAFQASTFETKAGATAAAVQRQFAADAARAKTRAMEQADQNALQVVLDQKVRYGQALRAVDEIENSLPNGFDVAAQIGMQAIMSYATFGVSPFAAV